MPRVTEVEAEGKVKTVFADIRVTLGTAAVGELFEELAVYPWFLQLAWRNLKPNAATAYFQRTARELEEMAIRSAGGRRHRGSADKTAPASPLEARLDLDAKLLTATAALRYGVNGQMPKMLWLPAEDKRSSLPAALDVLPGESPEPVPESKSAAELRQHAALSAESLPYRMEISATACRQSGLSEDQIDAVRTILNAAWDRLPRVLVAGAASTASTQKPAPMEPVAAV